MSKQMSKGASIHNFLGALVAIIRPRMEQDHCIANGRVEFMLDGLIERENGRIQPQSISRIYDELVAICTRNGYPIPSRRSMYRFAVARLDRILDAGRWR